MKRFFILMLMIFAMFSCTEVSEDTESSDNGKTNTTTDNSVKILWYDSTNKTWEATVSWTASNDLEKMMLASVDKLTLYVIDTNENTRVKQETKLNVNTNTYTVTGTYSFPNNNILKWADIPGTTVEARLSFTTGTTITVASQKGLVGPGATGKTFTAADFLLRDSKNEQIILANCMNNITADRYNYGDKVTKEFPIVKVAKIVMTAFGITYTATIDWTNEDLLTVYSDKVKIGESYGNGRSGLDWRSELAFSFSPCVTFTESSGTYSVTTADSCYFYSEDNNYGWFMMNGTKSTNTISNPNSSITLTVTSTTGTVHTISTSLSEILAIEKYDFAPPQE